MCSFAFSLIEVSNRLLLVGISDDFKKMLPWRSWWRAWRLARRLGVKTRAIREACRRPIGCAKQVPSRFDRAIDKLAKDKSFYQEICAPIGVMDARENDQYIALFTA
ncbi:MAG: hypothetical protein COU85_01395 [Candidatus Portnoybacteria bacterium CG10_big_fil_rev_8_21_14_0_10_44_7]|uniref:Uncharacterized protein n=1 Tax=Candidatus Portnoybacteria bacterium CG10_big_fil_rev_8_21_14_0_10_44_7 TaxID=1974816 RepID=A0A2M8KIV7_9BACT|nr:MAG: hypothetical protein COU85_01395 [Candidatus Portnoybacteria bacterium CG10_big_fil_rev_8_21_14_0_10_44_7]